MVGVDLGGTKAAVRVVGGDGGSHDSVVLWETGASAREDLALLARTIERACGEVGDAEGGVVSVGVAVPATLDRSGTVVAWPGRPAWVGVDVLGALGAMFPGASVRHGDDGDLAALAEADAAGCGDLLYVGVGTGVGGGIVSGGLPLNSGASCEVGHVVVERGGARCDCGRRGCVQAFASGPAILRGAAARGGRVEGLGDVRDGVARGEEWAVAAFEDAASALAALVIGVGELVRPELALIGGGVTTALPGLVPAVAERVAGLGRTGHPVPSVRPAVLGAESSLHGALVLAGKGNRE
ncbi:ROK family protein [Actinosynnema pretiosum]|uniref:ROK family protein n=1 Tax=Actinosynnema pretiosum TaxID=42197 RepID=UPI0020A33B72|nr:ROK family protein [Actinosynnema pretiosum]